MMQESERITLYNNAWKKWGSTTQIDMLIEEMAELTQALLKARRKGVVYSHDVYEEIADVNICMEQIKTRLRQLPVGLTDDSQSCVNIWDTHVMRLKEMKLERLQQLVNVSV